MPSDIRTSRSAALPRSLDHESRRMRKTEIRDSSGGNRRYRDAGKSYSHTPMVR